MIPRSALWFLVLLPGPLLGGEPPRLDRYGDPLPPGAIARMGTARLRVEQRMLAFAFWPDDQTLAACCWDGSVRFWERATGRVIRRVQTPLESVRAAVFVPGTQAVALLGEERELFLWDTASAQTVWRGSLPKYNRASHCLAASPDGKLLAIWQDEKTIDLYEPASGRKIRSLKGIEGSLFVFSPDSKSLAIVPSKPPVQLWDIHSGKKIRDLPSPDDLRFAETVAFSPDGKWIAVGGGFRKVFVSEVATGKEVSRLKCKDDAFYNITQDGLLFTADGKTLITGHYPGFVRFWDRATGQEKFSQEMAWQLGAWPVLSRDGKVLAVGDRLGREYRFIHLLDPATGKDVGPPAEGHESQLNFVAFSLDGKTLISSGRRTIREWHTETGEPGKQISRLLISDDAPVLSTDRKLLALPSTERVYLWEIGRDKLLRTLEYKGKDAIQTVAFAPDGKYLLSAHNHCTPRFGKGKIEGQDGLHFWDLATGKEIRSSATPTNDLYSQLVITPDGRLAIAGSEKGEVSRVKEIAGAWQSSRDSDGAGQLCLWDLLSGRQIRTLEGHKGAIRSLALSGDGRWLASASADHTVRLWELVSGKTLFTLPVGKTREPVATLSPDGRLLALGDETSLRMFSTATGKPVLELCGHHSEVRCLAVAPDNRRLASGLSDGTALVWDVSAACRAVRPETRRLSAKELESLWTDLADADALKAHRATWNLIEGGNAAIRILKGRFRPAENVEPKRIQQFLANLDADQFAVREAAMHELTKLGERAEPALNAALKDRPSLEARKRIEELLTRSLRRELSSEQLRQLRALRVLEEIGSSEARAALQSLATGCPDARLTQDATASLVRLQRRSTAP